MFEQIPLIPEYYYFFSLLPFVSADHQTRYPKAGERFLHSLLQWKSN